MKWIFQPGRSIYLQIVEQISVMIASRHYDPGQRLPSVRELAMEAGVNPNTMQRALAELERRGLVYSERTSGRFVTSDADVLEMLKNELKQQYVTEFFEKMMSIGIAAAEIAAAAADGPADTQPASSQQNNTRGDD